MCVCIPRSFFKKQERNYENRQTVRQQLDKLPQTQRRVIELSRFDNLAVRDIAQTLSLSEQTVKNNLSIGLKTLKKLLAEQSIVLLFLFYVNFV